MTLHLVIPGLLGPLPEIDVAGKLAGYAGIKHCLSRADQLPWAVADSRHTLFKLLNIDERSGQDLPTAAVALLGESGDAAAGWWMHADPVTLKADGDKLLLFDADQLDIQEAEATSLVTAFNDHFSCDGLQLHAPAVDRWYITASEKIAIQTSPLTDVVGRNIDTWLPQGPDAAHWRQILNEVQMLFYQHSVNAVREAAGRLPINGLWFSGCGHLPAKTNSAIAAICGEDTLLKGMASLGDTALESTHACLASDADSVVYITEVQRTVLDSATEAWLQQLPVVDQLLANLIAMKKNFMLYPGGNIAYHWQPSHRFKIWRSLPAVL